MDIEEPQPQQPTTARISLSHIPESIRNQFQTKEQLQQFIAIVDAINKRDETPLLKATQGLLSKTDDEVFIYISVSIYLSSYRIC